MENIIKFKYLFLYNKHNNNYNFRKKIIILYLIFNFYILLIINRIIKKNNLINNYKNIKVCLCIIGKGEKLYAKEYVNYYMKIGYNHIYLYDNNDINGERFEEVLENELNNGFVSIINFRGKKGIKEKHGDPQIESYFDCYEKNNKFYDWLSFFDFDEFLELKPINNIQKFLSNIRYEHCQIIKINFLFYSDNELLYYDSRPIQHRFTSPLLNHPNNIYIKSMVRGGLSQNYWKNTETPHTGKMKYKNCNSLGKKIKYFTNKNIPYNYKYAVLKHYYSKSVEEYCHKTKRGYAFFDKIEFDTKRKISKIENYFIYNKKTKIKIKLFKKLFSLKY